MTRNEPRSEVLPGARNRVALTWFLTAAALYAMCQVPFLNDLFGVDTQGINAASGHGLIQRHFEREGFFRLRGEPMVALVPSNPPEGDPYVNHPVLYHWFSRLLTWIFGVHEWSLRLTAALPTAFVCGLLTALARRWHGVWGGILTAALFLTMPLSFEYGRMPNYEGLFLALTVAALAVAGAPGGRGRGVAVAGLVFAATSVDWCGAFLVPALWLQGWMRDGRAPPWRQVLTWGLAACAAAASFLGLVFAWIGTPRETVKYFWDLYAHTAVKPEIVQHGPWAAGVSLDLWEVLTPAGIAALTAAFVWHVKMPSRAPAARPFFFASLLVVILNIAVFPGRAYAHEFWWFYILPAATLGAAAPFAAAAIAMRRAGRVRPSIVKLVMAVSVLALSTVAASGTARRYRAIDAATIRSGNQLMASMYDPRTLMVYWSDANFGLRSIYFAPYMRDVKGGLDTVARYAERFRRGEFRVDRLVVMVWLQNGGGPNAPTAADLPKIEAMGFQEGPRQLGPNVRYYELTR